MLFSKHSSHKSRLFVNHEAMLSVLSFADLLHFTALDNFHSLFFFFSSYPDMLEIIAGIIFYNEHSITPSQQCNNTRRNTSGVLSLLWPHDSLKDSNTATVCFLYAGHVRSHFHFFGLINAFNLHFCTHNTLIQLL